MSAPVVPVIAIVGPTATGKSDLALELAQTFNGEVINADASQLYAGMDIGTAKLPVDQRGGIAHHQLDQLHVTQEASVAAYQQAARRDVADIRERGHVPIVVGGSGLYVRALLDHLEIPPTDSAVRAKWNAALEQEGAGELHTRLQQSDPLAAEQIEPANGRRIVRALEVIELTGRPFSATMPRREYVAPTLQLGLRADRDVLDQLIARRAELMWQSGLLQEVRQLEGQGLRGGRTASRAVGYAQALAHLDGSISAQQAQEDMVKATRKLARRQQSWFGADPRVSWLAHDAADLAERASQIVRRATLENP